MKIKKHIQVIAFITNGEIHANLNLNIKNK